MANKKTLECFGSQGIKTDLWLTADKEVLPLTGKNPELQWKVLRKQRKYKVFCTVQSIQDEHMNEHIEQTVNKWYNIFV